MAKSKSLLVKKPDGSTLSVDFDKVTDTEMKKDIAIFNDPNSKIKVKGQIIKKVDK